MTDVDYTDYLGHLTNTPAYAESILYSLKQVAGDIDLCGHKKDRVHMI